MNRFIKAVGCWWLSGPKYTVSRWVFGADWLVGVEAALNKHGRSLKGCHDFESLGLVFAGQDFWKPDPVAQTANVIFPPLALLNREGAACGSWAMAHAQAVNAALGTQGWKAVILSYVADPWPESHHFAAATDPKGQVWAIQPEATVDQWAAYGRRLHLVFGPYKTYDEAVNGIVSTYANTRAVCFDVRDEMFLPLEPMEDL
jgi:hypothetical protein